jgi:hypothetical protein
VDRGEIEEMKLDLKLDLDLDFQFGDPRTVDSHNWLHDNISRAWYVYAIVAVWRA